MAKNCLNCAEKCPQAEMAHEAALGRMYATNEFLSLLKKVESGALVEVVRCKDCKHYGYEPYDNGDKACVQWGEWIFPHDDDFCSCGERKEND